MLALFGIWELVALVGIGRPYPSDRLVWLDAGYGTLSLLVGVALILLGVGTARARVLTGWARWMPLVTGVYVFVPMIPGLFAGFVIGRLVLAVWLALFVVLGSAMLRWAADAETEPALATTRSAMP